MKITMDSAAKNQVKMIASELRDIDKSLGDIARGAAILAGECEFDMDTALDLSIRVMELHGRGGAALTFEERVYALIGMAESSGWDDVLAMDDDCLVTELDEAGVNSLSIVVDNYCERSCTA